MRQPIYILSSPQNNCVAKIMKQNIPGSIIIDTDEYFVTEDVLLEIANTCRRDFFYLIKTFDEVVFVDFNFSYAPEEWDKDYLHIWNDDSLLRLYCCSSIKNNVAKYTDLSLESGQAEIKNHPKKIYEYPEFDIIFLSYDEPYANENFARLKDRFPRTQRVKNVKGILEAHKSAARLSDTGMFYVVDADADIVPNFEFDMIPQSLDRQSVHIWHSRNPVNGLEYGYGGVKLFPTDLLLNYTGTPVDFTTSVSESIKVIPEVSNITRFNTDPFSAWRSGFRECAKLAAGIIPNQDNSESEERLRIWCTKGSDAPFGDFVIEGANKGAKFGYENSPNGLLLINDFNWLEKQFNA